MKKISSKSLKSVLVSAESENTTLKGGAFTIKSNKSGKEFTYKITTKPFNGKDFTHVYIEQDYLNFKHIGTYSSGSVWKKGLKVTTPGATAISYVLDKVEKSNFDTLDSQMSTYHLGKCLKCGKELTDSNSIESGVGPVCASK